MERVKKTLLASYPRSGNTWLRYIIEITTGCATKGYEISGHSIEDPLIHPDKKIIANKRHSVDSVDEWKNMILLLRNPKECIIRHATVVPNNDINEYIIYELQKGRREKDRPDDGYLYLIDQYYKFSKPKMVIYYEDLISNDSKCYDSIFDFFQVDGSEFMDNIGGHREISINLYDMSETDGTQAVFHSKLLGDLDTMNEIMYKYK